MSKYSWYDHVVKDKNENWRQYMNERGVGLILFTFSMLGFAFYFFVLPYITRH